MVFFLWFFSVPGLCFSALEESLLQVSESSESKSVEAKYGYNPDNLISGRVIRIAYLRNDFPWTFINKESKPDGILMDLWRNWAKTRKVSLIFTPSTSKQAMDKLENGEIDVIAKVLGNDNLDEKLVDSIFLSEVSPVLFIKKWQIKTDVNFVSEVVE